jgi:hypothetical protein
VQTEQIVALLIEERDRLSRAIQALQNEGPRPSSYSNHPAPHAATSAARKSPARPKRVLSAAGRRAIAEAARKRWAAVRAAKAKSATAKEKEPEQKGANPRKKARA